MTNRRTFLGNMGATALIGVGALTACNNTQNQTAKSDNKGSTDNHIPSHPLPILAMIFMAGTKQVLPHLFSIMFIFWWRIYTAQTSVRFAKCLRIGRNILSS